MTCKSFSVVLAPIAVVLISVVAVVVSLAAAVKGVNVGLRGLQIVNGLLLVAGANVWTKRSAPAPRGADASRHQSALRFTAWGATLAGLAYAGLWLFAPMDLAASLGLPLVAVALAACFVFGRWVECGVRREI